MQITLNGKLRETEEETLAGLVAAYRLQPEAIVIEKNGALVKKTAWAATTIHAGDQIEIVAFVGGG